MRLGFYRAIAAMAPAAAAGGVLAAGSASPLLRDAPQIEVAAAPDEGVVRSRAVLIDAEAFAALGKSGRATLALDLFRDVRLVAALDSPARQPHGGFILRGRLADEPLSNVTVSVNGDVLLADIQSLSRGTFQLRYLGGGLHEVREVDRGAFPDCGFDGALEPHYEPVPEATAVEGAGFCEETGAVISVLVVYTTAAETGAGGAAAMNALISLAVDQTNQALANGGVPTEVILAGTQSVAYVESGGGSLDLSRLVAPDDGFMDEVHGLRNDLRADVVSLITNSGNVCGIARIAVGPGPTPLPAEAFNVVVRTCATVPIYAFAHEFGHSLGCRHDWPGDTCDDGAQPYAKAYVEPGGLFKTVVASGGNPAPAILYFSNPDVLFAGVPTGVPIDQADPAHNAASIISAAMTVANYRSTDCNGNGFCDENEIGGDPDCNSNGVLDECDADCDGNGVPDDCDIDGGAPDGNGNGIPDACEPPVLYVDADAAGLGTGTSWADAYTDLQDALAMARGPGGAVQEIWVAAGTYTPGPAPHRAATFRLINGVAIYGGFAGGESSLEERDPVANPTILGGDLNGDDGPAGSFANAEDNSLVIVNAGNLTDPTAVLDGFVITGGNSDLDTTACFFSPFSAGAGIHINKGSPTIRNCDVRYNSSEGNGGGLYVVNVADPTFVNCRFLGNRATGPLVSSSGGGAFLSPGLDNAVTMINCSFIGNSSSGGGGGIENICHDGLFYNCLFAANTAAASGGGMGNSGACPSTPTLISCTIYGNSSAGAGGGVYNVHNVFPIISNCILWANSAAGGMSENAQNSPAFEGPPVINNSCVMGWTGAWGGTGNTGADPLLADPDGADNVPGTADDDVRPTAGSPAIDAGDDALLADDFADLDGDTILDEPHSLDLDGFDRIQDGDGDSTPHCDMGAYELAGPSCPWDCDGSGDGNVNVADLLALLGQYDPLAPAVCGGGGSCDYNGNGCVDVTDLLKLLGHYTTDPLGVGCP